MELLMNYIKPQLIIVAIALYFIGVWIKDTEYIKDKWIPVILGIVSIIICAIWVLATTPIGSGQALLMAIFTAIIQGILVAALSTYVNQLIKQYNKIE